MVSGAKFSSLPTAVPAATDTIVGVRGGATDSQYTVSTIGLLLATSNLTFYVSTTGNDSTAVANDITHPYATTQAAVNAAVSYNWNNSAFFPTIQYFDGTYSAVASNMNFSPMYGTINSGISFQGHVGDATKVILTDVFQMSGFPSGASIGWITFNVPTATNGSAINPVDTRVDLFGDMIFAGNSIPFYLEGISELLAFNINITLTNSGPIQNFIYTSPGVVWFQGVTVNLPVSLTISDSFLHMTGLLDQSGHGVTLAQFSSTTFNNAGGVTGPAISAKRGVVLQTVNGEISDIPGSTPGLWDNMLTINSGANGGNNSKQGITWTTLTHTLTAADIPQNTWRVVKDSTPARYLAMNDGGTLYKVALT